MITMRIKDQFFDRPAVQKSMLEVERGALSKAAAFIWRRARSSMRKRKRSSKPGQPPSVHEGSLRKMLYFGWDTQTRSALIGPVGFNGSNVPETLEYGGTVTQTRKRWGKTITKTVTIAPRPYMGPAFDKEREKIPANFRDRMRKGVA